MKLSEALKILRKELNMTQQEFADALHLHLTTVNRWEKDKTTPKAAAAAELFRLAEQAGASAQCRTFLRQALSDAHQTKLNMSNSQLYSVERDAICQLVDHSVSAIMVCDVETDEVLYANRQAERIAGRRFEKDSGQVCYRFLQHVEHPCSYCPKRIYERHEYADAYIVSERSGHTFHVNGMPIVWNGRKAHAEYFRDTTYALEAQHGLKHLMDHIAVGICVYYVHRDGVIQLAYANDGYYALLDSTRKKRERYFGFHAMEAVGVRDRSRIQRLFRENAGQNGSFDACYHAVMDDGTEKALKAHAAFIQELPGKKLYYCTVETISGEQGKKEDPV